MDTKDIMVRLEFLEPREAMDTMDSFEDIMGRLPMKEKFEDMVERIARAWFETTCPPEEGDDCCLDLHDWSTAHPGDKDSARNFVGFVLHEAGIE